MNNLIRLSNQIYSQMFSIYKQHHLAETLFILRNPNPILQFLVDRYSATYLFTVGDFIKSFNRWLGLLTLNSLVELDIVNKLNVTYHDLIELVSED